MPKGKERVLSAIPNLTHHAKAVPVPASPPDGTNTKIDPCNLQLQGTICAQYPQYYLLVPAYVSDS